MLAQTYVARWDLQDMPRDNPEWMLFTDGSSFIEIGARQAGYAAVTWHETTEGKVRPPGTSAQPAEVTALT